MHRFVLAAAMPLACLALALPSIPALAVTAKDKMATCKFGADAQKLAGKQRADFLKRCMANRNDPRGPAPAAGSPALNAPPEADQPDGQD
jgi:hypothetical protein